MEAVADFGKIFQEISHNYKIYYPSKKILDITNIKKVNSYTKKIKPDYFIHCAALSRPMNIHDRDLSKSIDLNIIGTSNVVKCCQVNKNKIDLFFYQLCLSGI